MDFIPFNLKGLDYAVFESPGGRGSGGIPVAGSALAFKFHGHLPAELFILAGQSGNDIIKIDGAILRLGFDGRR